jgi:hypothetical protein
MVLVLRRERNMPFSLISTVLGGCFALVWVFIGAMIVRDSQFALRRDRESDTFSHSNLPASRGQQHAKPHVRFGQNGRQSSAGRQASAATL